MVSIINYLIDKQLYPPQKEVKWPSTFYVNGTRCLIRFHEQATAWLIFCHGNSDSIDNLASKKPFQTESFVDHLSKATDYTCNIVIPEFPKLLHDVRGKERDDAMVDSVRNAYLGIQNHDLSAPIFVVAHSLGVALALHACAELEAERAPAGMILVSGFGSVRNLAPYMMSCAIPDRLNNMKQMAQLASHVPVVVVHGTNDVVIPVAEADALYHACQSQSKKLITISNADHNIMQNPKVLHLLRCMTTQQQTTQKRTTIDATTTFQFWEQASMV